MVCYRSYTLGQTVVQQICLTNLQGSVINGKEMDKIKQCATKMIGEEMEAAWDAELINECQKYYQWLAGMVTIKF